MQGARATGRGDRMLDSDIGSKFTLEPVDKFVTLFAPTLSGSLCDKTQLHIRD
jgi:hypothetical protein